MRTQRRWQRFWKRLAWGLLIVGLLILAPCPVWTPEIFTWWQVPLVVLGFILYIGVLLFDTLFFSRYL